MPPAPVYVPVPARSRRTLTLGVVALHIALGWVLLQSQRVREAGASAVPLTVATLAPEAPARQSEAKLLAAPAFDAPRMPLAAVPEMAGPPLWITGAATPAPAPSSRPSLRMRIERLPHLRIEAMSSLAHEAGLMEERDRDMS